MTDVVTCSPDCDYCDHLAEFQCDECGAYACVDHVFGRQCWRCHEAEGAGIGDAPFEVCPGSSEPGPDWGRRPALPPEVPS